MISIKIQQKTQDSRSEKRYLLLAAVNIRNCLSIIFVYSKVSTFRGLCSVYIAHGAKVKQWFFLNDIHRFLKILSGNTDFMLWDLSRIELRWKILILSLVLVSANQQPDLTSSLKILQNIAKCFLNISSKIRPLFLITGSIVPLTCFYANIHLPFLIWFKSNFAN